MNQKALSSFLWSVADLLRGDYKQADFGKVILPFTVLRLIDCLLGPTKDAVLKELALWKAQWMKPEPCLLRKSGQTLHNTSKFDSLMVNLLCVEDDDALSKPVVVRAIYDSTAGTGGKLSVAGEYLTEYNDQASSTVPSYDYKQLTVASLK